MSAYKSMQRGTETPKDLWPELKAALVRDRSSVRL